MAIIDTKPPRHAALQAESQRVALGQHSLDQVRPQALRNRERLTVERVNWRLKDEFGERHGRVCGHAKVLCHLIFGMRALTVG